MPWHPQSSFPLFSFSSYFFFSLNFVFLVFCENVTFSFLPIEFPHSFSPVWTENGNSLFRALQTTGNHIAGTNITKCLPFWSYKFLEAWMPFAISPFLLLADIAGDGKCWSYQVNTLFWWKRFFYLSELSYISGLCLIYTWLTVCKMVLWFCFSFIWQLTNIIFLADFHGDHIFQTKIQDPESNKGLLCQFCHWEAHC